LILMVAWADWKTMTVLCVWVEWLPRAGINLLSNCRDTWEIF
jgi:hypothetical protein